jgi:hypothetical protein
MKSKIKSKNSLSLFSAEKKKSLQKFLFLAVAATICTALVFSISSCSLIYKNLQNAAIQDNGNGQTGPGSETASEDQDDDGKDSSGTGDENGSSSETSDTSEVQISDHRLAFFEVGSDEKSNHFEHRVGYIYSVKPDGTDKKLVYSDIDQQYDLGFIFGASPDGTKILAMLTEGGRGLYSALVMIDTATGSLKKLYEMDYTEMEGDGSGDEIFMLSIYGNPVWSADSKKIAFELVSNPDYGSFSDMSKDAGIQIVDVESGDISELNVDVGGLSARTTTFLQPVLFSPDGGALLAVSRIYFEKQEEDETVGFFSMPDALFSLNMEGGQPEEVLNISGFEGLGPEIIQSFNYFKLSGDGRVIFQLLGDFEEDGDLWICEFNGDGLEKITSDTTLREQQPGTCSGCGNRFAYIGSNRYGTIASQIPSGDVFISDLTSLAPVKLTEYNFTGASSPVLSSDGSYIGYIFSHYDENYTYVEKNTVMIVDSAGEEIIEVLPEKNNYIFTIAGWITD